MLATGCGLQFSADVIQSWSRLVSATPCNGIVVWACFGWLPLGQVAGLEPLQRRPSQDIDGSLRACPFCLPNGIRWRLVRFLCFSVSLSLSLSLSVSFFLSAVPLGGLVQQRHEME